eukprot:gene18994-25578_t
MGRSKGGRRGGGRSAPAHSKAEAWMDSFPKVSKWMGQYDVEALIQKSGGLVRVSNFLPDFVADALHDSLDAIPEKSWLMTSAGQDHSQNNILHAFWSTKQAPGLDRITRLFSTLVPDSLHTFSAARYMSGHHIDPHDDRAYTEVTLDNGRLLSCSRDIAVIYYLTKGGVQYVPQYNSAVLFRIPRYHQVTPVKTALPRFTIFGWFLVPGKLYKLFTGEEDEGMKRAKGIQHDMIAAGTMKVEEDEGMKRAKGLQEGMISPGSMKHGEDVHVDGAQGHVPHVPHGHPTRVYGAHGTHVHVDGAHGAPPQAGPDQKACQKSERVMGDGGEDGPQVEGTCTAASAVPVDKSVGAGVREKQGGKRNSKRNSILLALSTFPCVKRRRHG